MAVTTDRLIWLDLEMTGLSPEQDVIIEIATIVTDDNLNILAEGPVLAVQQSESRLAGMDEWNTRTHTASGLVQRVKDSPHREAEVEQLTLDFLRQHVEAGKSPMCGNTICQDRRFLARYMPQLEAFFHYRNLDVSSVKELVKRWRPDILPGFKKQNAHEALADIRESIAELNYYREHFFIDQPESSD